MTQDRAAEISHGKTENGFHSQSKPRRLHIVRNSSDVPCRSPRKRTCGESQEVMVPCLSAPGSVAYGSPGSARLGSLEQHFQITGPRILVISITRQRSDAAFLCGAAGRPYQQAFVRSHWEDFASSCFASRARHMRSRLYLSVVRGTHAGECTTRCVVSDVGTASGTGAACVTGRQTPVSWWASVWPGGCVAARRRRGVRRELCL